MTMELQILEKHKGEIKQKCGVGARLLKKNSEFKFKEHRQK